MKTALTGVRAEFRRATDERDFRDWSFRETCDQARIAILVVPVLVLSGLPIDIMSMGLGRAMALALPVRLLFLAVAMFEFTQLRRVTRIETVDRAVTLLQGFLFLTLYYFVALGNLASTEHLLIALFVVLASYLIFPNRFVTMVRLGVFGGIGYVTVVGVFFGLEEPVLTLLGGVAIANVFGAITAHRLHVAKRREYLRLIEQRHLNEELRALNSDLEALATTDSLTGINNRRHFFTLASDELSRAKRYQRPLTALMIDIDRFKLVNDRHGHSGGDKVLRAVVQTCITTLRETDVLGRLGGDEFAILLPETSDGKDQADRLRRTVERLRTTLDDGTDLTLTVSIGVTSVRPEDESIDEVLARADEAMYQAKQNGRNSVATV